MISNFLTIAWRNIIKHKSFSLINILGLSIGIAACLIIYLYIHNELTYDLYNAKAARIVRVTTTIHAPESDVVMATAPNLLADVTKKDLPEVESAVRLAQHRTIVRSQKELYREQTFYQTDPSIFSIFTFDFVEGSPSNALKNPGTIVINQTMAKKYFGDERCLGKIMICDGENKLITGVFKNRPVNSDLEIDALLSNDFSQSAKWMDDFNVYCFVLFRTTPDLVSFKKKLSAISSRYIQPELNAMGATAYQVKFEPEFLSDVHFSQGKYGDSPKGNRQFNFIFSLLAILILVIALLNYINLSTAKSADRAKEVGVRKVSGARKIQLVSQFMSESFFLVAIACALALMAVACSLPFFNRLLLTHLSIGWPRLLSATGFIFVITLLLAGIYPALVLSSFKPIKVLKGSWRQSLQGLRLRKAVSIIQFGIAAMLIMGTTVIYQQMQFIDRKDLGFNKDQLLSVYLPEDSALQSSVKAFQQALRQRPEVTDLTVGNRMTIEGLSMGTTIAENNGKKRELMCNYFQVDPHYLSVFQIHLLEGRNFSEQFGTDKQEAFIVNEAFVREMGWHSGLGKDLEGMDHKGKIVGVVKNYYYKSLHNLVEPLVLVYNNRPGNNTTTMRIRPSDLPTVKTVYQKYMPTVPIDYHFFDDILNKQYEKDRVTMSLFSQFTLLAIFVSCLGLYGLVALIVTHRTREIGIRKILGASVNQLFTLMTKDFLLLVLIALVIALPVAGLAMHQWLQTYAYHIPLVWWMFGIPVLLLLLITLGVISREIIKTALISPAKSLRTE